MQIEVFEVKSKSCITEISTDVDSLLFNIFNKYKDRVSIKKINVLDKEAMKEHKDIVKMLDKEGLDCLPIIKVDGKLVDENKFEIYVSKKLNKYN